MNISKLNPIGYESKTAKGNTYKKSNIGKTACLLGVAALDTSLTLSKNPALTPLRLSAIAKELGIQNPKAKTALAVAGLAVDAILAYTLGFFIDTAINNKRAIKADIQA